VDVWSPDQTNAIAATPKPRAGSLFRSDGSDTRFSRRSQRVRIVASATQRDIPEHVETHELHFKQISSPVVGSKPHKIQTGSAFAAAPAVNALFTSAFLTRANSEAASP